MTQGSRRGASPGSTVPVLACVPDVPLEIEAMEAHLAGQEGDEVLAVVGHSEGAEASSQWHHDS